MSHIAETLFAGICRGMTLQAVGVANGMSLSGVWNALNRAGLPTTYQAAVKAGLAAPGVTVPHPSVHRQPTNQPARRVRGWAGYATILRELQIKPRSSMDLAADIACGYTMLQVMLGRMCELGLVHEREWRRGEQGRWVLVWAAGKGRRAPHPTTGAVKARAAKAYRHRPELIAFANIMRALAAEPMTALALSVATGCGRNNLMSLMLHCERIGLARVAGWELREDGAGRPAALWALSNGVRPRAARPPILTRQQIDARNWARRKAKAQMLRVTAALTGGIRPVSAACRVGELEAA